METSRVDTLAINSLTIKLDISYKTNCADLTEESFRSCDLLFKVKKKNDAV